MGLFKAPGEDAEEDEEEDIPLDDVCSGLT
jgi:hypothetical protein